MNTKIAVAVKHPIMRRGVACILREAKELKVVAEAGDMTRLNEVCVETSPNLVIVEGMFISIQQKITLNEVMKRHPKTRFVVLWLHERPSERQLAFSPFNIELDWTNPGALRNDVLYAITTIPEVDHASLTKIEQGKLTARETEVLDHIARGFSTNEIADQLSISARTAELHRYRICRKLGINSPLEMAKYLIRQGLIPL